MFVYIAQKSVEPMFNLNTNYFKPNRLKHFHNRQILKRSVTILQHKSLITFDIFLVKVIFLASDCG